MRTNILLVCYPALLCILIVVLQNFLNEFIKKANNALPKQCDPKTNPNCPTPEIPKLPPLLQVPEHPYRAVRTDFIPFTDLPDESCRRTSSCPATILLTGNNRSLGEILAGTMITSSLSTSQVLTSLVKNELARVATNVLGSSSMPPQDLTPLGENDIIHDVQHQCPKNSISHVYDPVMGEIEVDLCVKGLVLWRNNSTVVNDELYKGYYKGNPDGKINEIIAAYDFLNSNKSNFNVSIWYNSSYSEQSSSSPLGDDSDVLLRIPRSVNLASNAYLHFRRGPGTQMLFEFVKDMNQLAALGGIDVASAFGPLFFTWVVLQLFPVALKSLVYEKQQKLRIMMKMHGLGNGPYWMISYLYFLFVSSIYMFIFVTSGALIVIAYICVFGTGFLADYLFDSFVQSNSFPKMLIIVLELYPGFSLYRGINEFAQYVQLEGGMRWEDLNDSENGMREVLIIMSVEWFVVLFVAYGMDRAVSPGSGVGRRRSQNSRKPSLQSKGSRAYDMDKADVNQEREKVDQLLHESSTSHAIVCDNLQKIYPGRDGNPEKFAVRGLYLAVPPGECFGMLGPNGAGKTSFISMMIGLTKPTSGTAFIQGLDLQTHMDEIYTSMGVCPQHDLLWETLTGREHLLFYGRLKDLKGSELTQAVEESLKSLNLFHGGVADKQAGKYSGGMKRRLSVAISLIGDPKVVYMDEPSTGLDPASRNNLWNVVKNAKKNRAIILTTHSMEEAEFLCDRLGFFVDGSLQCIGNPKELKARYGGSYVFTITTSSDHEEEVENMVQHFSPSANKVYQLSGTQKFELPKSEARIADVFQVVETAKSKFTVFAWGLADTNLEDVFIKVSREARQSNTLT
uniref:ABC transporter domain-containing protein n=1 Tax=Fagus sylvatica TaxID=28930 RepID=A0A2N9H4E4_FAGSY